VAVGVSVPSFFTVTVTAAAVVGATSLTTTITAPGGVTGKTIVNGTYAIVGTGAAAQTVVLAANALQTATTITVDPILKPIAANATFRVFVDAIPVIGLEAANLQLQKQVNEVVLLASRGWSTRSYSTGSFQFSGNLYIPVSVASAVGARMVYDALITEKMVYVERFFSNGDYQAGLCLVSDASDTASGAQYLTVSTTFQGTGELIMRTIPAV
jgi:hypothetical protein